MGDGEVFFSFGDLKVNNSSFKVFVEETKELVLVGKNMIYFSILLIEQIV